MNKIGTTSSGSVIVEMTPNEFQALQQLQGHSSPSKAQTAAATQGGIPLKHGERVTYVAERLKKLSPKKKDGVIRSIQAMFQFSGGLEESETEKLITALQKQKFFSITHDGRVTYLKD